MSCRLWVAVAVLVLVAWSPADRVVAQEKQIQEIDEATLKEWKGRFSKQHGYMGVDISGKLVFASQPGGLRSAVPAFRREVGMRGTPSIPGAPIYLSGLPHPKVPFGLWIEVDVGFGGQFVAPPPGAQGPIEAIAGLEHLTHLKLKGSVQNSDMETVAELSSLTHLDLQNAHVSGPGLKRLAGLKGLTHLNFQGTKIRGPWLKHLAGLDRLTDLFVDSVDDDDLKHLVPLKKLARLSIRPQIGFSLSADGVKHLAGLPELVHLELGANVTEVDVTALRKALPKCKVVVYGEQPR